MLRKSQRIRHTQKCVKSPDVQNYELLIRLLSQISRTQESFKFTERLTTGVLEEDTI